MTVRNDDADAADDGDDGDDGDNDNPCPFGSPRSNVRRM